MRHHALLVRRSRLTNAMHSSSVVVCVGIFVHAQNCARSSTRECTRQKDASHAQSALDQRQTHAGHTRSTRCACVVFSSMEADYKFIWADIGGIYMGSTSDAQMCNASELKECAEAWSRMGSFLLLPLPPRPLSPRPRPPATGVFFIRYRITVI